MRGQGQKQYKNISAESNISLSLQPWVKKWNCIPLVWVCILCESKMEKNLARTLFPDQTTNGQNENNSSQSDMGWMHSLVNTG